MVVVVTGGSGFIGTNLIQFYLNKGIQVINLDIVKPINSYQLNNWVKCDLMNPIVLKQTIEKIAPDYVIHLAARTDLDGKSIKDYDINIQGTVNLINAISELKGVKKVLFTSSMLVCHPGYIPKNDIDFSPTTIYGQSKIEMELIIRQANLSFDWAIIRPTSIWGPWFGTPYRDFFDTVINKRFIKILGTPILKSYGFVLNSVYQIDKLLMYGPTVDKVFYIGDKPPLVIQEWADEIAVQIGTKSAISLPYFVFAIAAKVGDILKAFSFKFPMTSFRLKNMSTNNVVPLDKLYEISGTPPYDIKQGVSITLDWLNHHGKR